MTLLIIVGLLFFIAHIIEERKREDTTYTLEVEQSIENAWKNTDQTTVPADMLVAYRKYLISNEWYTLRKIVLQRDNYRCVRCSSIDNLQVHHTNYRGIYENFNFSIDQLECVCQDCHNVIHLGILPMRKSL